MQDAASRAAAAPLPTGNELAAGRPGARSPEKEAEAERVRSAGPRRCSAPAPPSRPRPAAAGPASLFRELSSGAAPARHGPGGHRRRGSGNVAPRVT